jgi:hypothetical protein
MAANCLKNCVEGVIIKNQEIASKEIKFIGVL